MTTALARIDHETQAIGFLRHQDRGKPAFEAIVGGIGAGAQLVEDDIFAIAMSASLPSATGRLLDIWGEMVGEDREGASDNVYRRFILARALLHQSQGRPEDLYAIWTALWGVDGRAGHWAEMSNPAPRLMELRAWIPSFPPDPEIRRAARLMRAATPIGMNLRLVLLAGSRAFGYAGHGSHDHPAALGYDAGTMGRSI